MASKMSHDKLKYYDQEVRHLPFSIIQQLALLLDDPYDNTMNWKGLIAAMPPGTYKQTQVMQFGMAGMRAGGSPTESLLQDMGHKRKTVRQLIGYLDKLGHTEALELLKPDEPVEITEQPKSVPVQAGQRCEFCCKATGFPPPRFQWLKDGAELPNGLDSTLVIEKATARDEGGYLCVVSNRMNAERTNVVKLQVLPVQGHTSDADEDIPEASSPPLICQQPQSALIPVGHNYYLTCHTKTPAKHQWFKDGFRLRDERRQDIHFKPFNYQDEGNYTCRVYNTAGDALSAVATLQTPTPNPQDQFIGHGSQRSDLTQVAADKVALVIGNRDYINLREGECPLVHPCSDAQRLASILRKRCMNFKVISLVNLTRAEMNRAIDLFCDLLGEGVYGLLYFAGHGFQEQGQNYMVPIDAERDWAPDNSVCVQGVFKKMHERGTLLNIFLLDICRQRALVGTQPFKMEKYSFPYEAQVVFGYATCPDSDAYERKSDSNGLYMTQLLKHVILDVKIEDVLHNIAKDFEDVVAADENVERMRPLYESKTSRAFSLLDPIDPSMSLPSEMEERRKMWLEIHRLPEKHILEHHGIQIEIRFEHTNWLSNVIVVCLRVLNLGEATMCDASLSLDNLPKDFQDCHFHESTTNVLRQVLPRQFNDETRARTWKIETPAEMQAPVPVERISEIYNIHRLKKNLTLTIKLHLRSRELEETKYMIKAFNIKEFGISSAFA